MLVEEVEEIIRKGEGQTVDFKASGIFSDPLKLAKLMVAFANNLHVSTSYGGLILIGVNDDGSFEGMKSKQGHEELIMNVARDKCDPQIAPKFDLISISGNDIYVITVPKMKNYPHALRLSDSNAYYVRVGTTVRVANREELLELFVSSGKPTINQVIQRVRESIPAYSGPYRSVLIAPEYLTKNLVQLSRENEIRLFNFFDRTLDIGNPVPTQNGVVFRMPGDKAYEYYATITQEGIIFYREAIHESARIQGGMDTVGLHLHRTMVVIRKMLETAQKVYEDAKHNEPCLLKFEAANIRGLPLIFDHFNRFDDRFESGSVLNIDRELSWNELENPKIILESIATELCRSFGFHLSDMFREEIVADT